MQKSQKNNIATHLKLSFVFLVLEMIVASLWGANSRAEYVLPIFGMSILAILPLFFSKEQSFVYPLEKAIFFSGVYLAIIGFIQFLNPAYEVLHYQDFNYVEKIGFIPFLPLGVDGPISQGNSITATCKILSLCITLLVCIKLFRSHRLAFYALNSLALCSFVVAIIGIVEKVLNVPILYGVILTSSDFHATFFLSSAAGSFINMGLSGAFALLFYNAKKKRIFLSLFWFVVSVLSIWSIYLSKGNGAIIISIIITLFFICFVLFDFLRRRLNVKATLCILFVVGGFFTVFGINEISKGKINIQEANQYENIRYSIVSRFEVYVKDAILFMKHPFFGVGGECCQYTLPLEVSESQLNRIGQQIAAPARPHCDIFEYFIEYGLFGAFVFPLCFALWLFRIWKLRKRLTLENSIIFIGVLMCAFHSMFDLVLHVLPVMLFGGILAILVVSPIDRRFNSEI